MYAAINNCGFRFLFQSVYIIFISLWTSLSIKVNLLFLTGLNCYLHTKQFNNYVVDIHSDKMFMNPL